MNAISTLLTHFWYRISSWPQIESGQYIVLKSMFSIKSVFFSLVVIHI